ncbi:RidA family protein [Clostridia bacterium]|nr:RidA family protein [Clostridia bacterium]
MNKQSFHPEGLFPTKDYGFSHVVSVKANKLIFCSGQAAQDANGQVIGKGDFGVQLRKSMENIKLALEEAGSCMEDICRLKLYIVNLDSEKMSIISEEMTAAFERDALPANTLIGVQALADPDLLIEIEVTAAVM